MSVYHGVRSMDRSADIEESLVVLEKVQRDDYRDMEVKMDQQQQEEEVETGTTTPVTGAAAAGVDRTPVHVRIDLRDDYICEIRYSIHRVGQINTLETPR